MNRSIHRGRPSGYALLEVLVTLVILLIGLLGLAGVNARANVTEMESYQRIQALVLLQDMIDRLNANRGVAPCYSNGATGVQVGTTSSTGYTGVPSLATCALTTDINGNPVAAAQKSQAIAVDLPAWETALQGSAEINGGSKIGAMIGAVGCVRQIDATNNIYLVSVSWQGLADTAAPTDATGTTCGSGTYGAETKHRMVAATVQIATLYVPSP
jgi:type IV pilus assembly protein PilV